MKCFIKYTLISASAGNISLYNATVLYELWRHLHSHERHNFPLAVNATIPHLSLIFPCTYAIKWFFHLTMASLESDWTLIFIIHKSWIKTILLILKEYVRHYYFTLAISFAKRAFPGELHICKKCLLILTIWCKRTNNIIQK